MIARQEGKVIGQAEVLEVIRSGISDRVRGKKVLVLTPDKTRTCPLPLLIRSLQTVLQPLAERIDYMVALGSHPMMTETEIQELYGIDPQTDEAFNGSRFMNHRWDLPETLTKIGSFSEAEIAEISGGLFREGVNVSINRLVLEYDLIVILGPVFPHEVVGFSGGNKYLFPGISGGEFLHFFHWMSAVMSTWKTIGIKDTPARRLLTRAARMIATSQCCVSVVVNPDNTLAGIYAGDTQEAWSDAADLSARLHVVYKDRPFHTVLGRAPEMYDEIWVAGKVMYKLEPVVAAGGRLIIYGPHIREISVTWGKQIERVGYHVAEYFLKQMENFRDIPRGVLAHSVHVRGLGSYENGVEKPRIDVILATAIPEEKCRQVNFGYLDPREIRISDYQNRESEGILFVDHAGETLHRLKGEQP